MKATHIYVVQIGMLLIMMIKLDSIEKALTTMVSTCMEMKLLQTSETYRMVLLAAGRITPAQYNVLEVFYLIQQ
jgi:hypothetical protein